MNLVVVLVVAFYLNVSSAATTGPTIRPTVMPSVNYPEYIAVVAGTGTGTSSDSGARATSTSVYAPKGVFLDSLGSLYISESSGNCVRKITNDIVQNYAGKCLSANGATGDGGAATAALFNHPMGIAVNTLGLLFIADNGNYRVRSVSPSNQVIGAYAGDGGTSNAAALVATSVSLDQPTGLWVGTNNDLYVNCGHGYYIKKITASGTVSTFAGKHCSFCTIIHHKY